MSSPRTFQIRGLSARFVVGLVVAGGAVVAGCGDDVPAVGVSEPASDVEANHRFVIPARLG